MPIDMFISVVLPAHTYLGLRIIGDDYYPGTIAKSVGRVLAGILALLMSAGLLYLTWDGEGVGATIRRLWTSKPKSIHDTTL